MEFILLGLVPLVIMMLGIKVIIRALTYPTDNPNYRWIFSLIGELMFIFGLLITIKYEITLDKKKSEPAPIVSPSEKSEEKE